MLQPGHLPDNFFVYLLAANRPQLDGWQRWLFHPGMLFQSRQQWWGNGKPRSTPHEGLDLCWFQDVADRRRALDHTTVIPAPFSGKIVNIIDDFLGQSIFLAHDIMPAEARRLFFAVGHTSLREGLAVGQNVQAGEILAAIAAPANRQGTVPPHLHITLALIPDSLAATHLNWQEIGVTQTITLLVSLKIFPTCLAHL